MIFTLFVLNQLLMPGYKPVAVLHQQPVQGIVLHQEPVTPVATFKVTQPKPIATFKYEQPKGITITPNKVTPVATWSLQ